MKQKISLFILILLAIGAGIFVYVNRTLQPLPENERNASTSNTTMRVRLKDAANRTPIVRTYTQEEFAKLDAKEMARIKEVVNGNREGDVPALSIENGKGTLEFSFEKTRQKGADTPVLVVPKEVPEIKISATETLYSKEEPKVITDSLRASEEGKYVYDIEKYLNTQKVQLDTKEEFYAESMYIEIRYQMDDEGYVSIFAINTVQDE